MDEAKPGPLDEQGYSSPVSRGRDQWQVRLTTVSLLVWLLTVLWAGMPGPLNLLAIPIVVLGGPAAALVIFSRGAHLLHKGKPRKAMSVALIAILPPLLWNPTFWLAECAHIALTTRLGIGQIGTPSISRDGRFATYDWSVGLVSNPDTFLIYDDTDEIALPASKHQHPLASENGFGKDCAGRVTHLIGHYYECTF